MCTGYRIAPSHHRWDSTLDIAESKQLSIGEAPLNLATDVSHASMSYLPLYPDQFWLYDAEALAIIEFDVSSVMKPVPAVSDVPARVANVMDMHLPNRTIRP
jgi:hypothetical protein